jgi:hypothetical protein
MRFNTLSRVAGALAVSAILGSMPAFADDRGDKDDRHRGERAQCSIVSAFVYQSTEFNLPVIDVYGSGFSNKGKKPKVNIAGVDVGDFIVKSTDTRVVLAFEPGSPAVLELYDAIPGPTIEVDETKPGSVQLKLDIMASGRNRTPCSPITIASGLILPPIEQSNAIMKPLGMQLIMGDTMGL